MISHIATHGICNPIEVNYEFKILDGLHRYQAARRLGLEDLPFIMRKRGLSEILEERTYMPLSHFTNPKSWAESNDVQVYETPEMIKLTHRDYFAVERVRHSRDLAFEAAAEILDSEIHKQRKNQRFIEAYGALQSVRDLKIQGGIKVVYLPIPDQPNRRPSDVILRDIREGRCKPVVMIDDEFMWGHAVAATLKYLGYTEMPVVQL